MAAATMANTPAHPMQSQTTGVIGPSTHATKTKEAKPTALAATRTRTTSTVAAAIRSCRR
jgi:hypothetical protein